MTRMPNYYRAVFGYGSFTVIYFGKSGSTDEENPELLPNNGDAKGMTKEPLPAAVEDGDVREGGDKVMGSDEEKVLLVGEDINGPISKRN